MEKINRIDYLKYCVENKLYGKLSWLYAMLSIGVDDITYVKIQDGKVLVMVNGNYMELITKSLPILNKEEKLLLPKGYISSIETDIETDAHILLVNLILLYEHFGDSVPYINGEISIGKIEGILAPMIASFKISIDKFLAFQDACIYMLGIAPLVTHSNSPLLLLPPPNIKEYKKKVIDDIKKKYKLDEITKLEHIAEVESKLIEYDNEFLKDDPAYGKFISGKIKDARKKMYLSYGAESGLGDSDDNHYATNSLTEGWEENPDSIATYFNGSRAGSYGRGAETADGGLLAKIALRATNHIRVKHLDCGTKLGKTMLVSNFNIKNIYGKYILVNGKTVKINDPKEYIGKTITLRTVAYCSETNNNVCSTCVGDNLSRNETAIPGAIADFGSILLTIKMKGMHKMLNKLIELDMDDICT